MIGTASGRQVYGKSTVSKPKISTAQNIDKNTKNDTIKIVAKPDINNLSKHFAERQTERAVSIDDIKDAINNPLKVMPVRDDRTQQIIGERATIGVNVETGKITTVWRTGERRRKKYKKEKDK